MANPQKSFVLTINGGSSSIRFALFQAKHPLKRELSGKMDRIGLGESVLTFKDEARDQEGRRTIKCRDHKSAVNFMIDWLEERIDFSKVKSVGHRVVFGMKHAKPERVTSKLLRELRRYRPYDPEHLPREIELMEAFCRRHPRLLQVACFDTAFHRAMPRVARVLPIPRRFDKKGVQRYGFHGLSYAYLMGSLARVGGAKEARGRVILAHLGNGASMAAVWFGKSVDTTMGFTPAGGLPMGTRPGDLDPGVAWTLMSAEHLSPQQFNHLINHESGLLGVSETSSDMRDLIKRQANDIRAREAVELFCYQAKKWIGAFAASLGGLDTLVFSGGIGENSSEVRSRICEGLGFLGIDLDAKRNKKSDEIISKKGSRVAVRVIRTDEEVHIANLVLKHQRQGKKEGSA